MATPVKYFAAGVVGAAFILTAAATTAAPPAPHPSATAAADARPPTDCTARLNQGHWSDDMWTGSLAHCAALYPITPTTGPGVIIVSAVPTVSPR